MEWTAMRRSDVLSVPDRLSLDLERLILSGELQPGEKLPNERDLADHLGVSRVSIRQALHELNARGMVDRRPGRGTIVLPMGSAVGSAGTALQGMLTSSDALELQRIMELRSLIEPPIAGLAAARVSSRDVEQLRALVSSMETETDLDRYGKLDRAFHQAISQYAHNPLLAQLTDLISTQIAPSRRRSLQSPERRQTSNAAHRRIFEAIESRDSKRAEDEARAHVTTVFEQVLRAHTHIDGEERPS